MSSVSSTTSLTEVMQMFSSVATPALSSLLSSSTVQSALAKSSPADLVQLSDQAMLLQEAEGLFGASTPTSPSTGSNVNVFA
jgi:hypothetical protein